MLFIAIVTCWPCTNFSIIYTLCSIISILDLLIFKDCDFASFVNVWQIKYLTRWVKVSCQVL